LARDPYAVVVQPPAAAELAALRAFDQRRIADAIQAGLTYEPFTPSRNRKELKNPEAGFEYEPPLWELRVGEFRVFYDGKADSRTVYVRAVRQKPSGKTTREIAR